jgi:hypothetical protein
MLLRLLFGPEGQEDVTRLPAGCAGERKSQREQAKTSLSRVVRCSVRLIVCISVTAAHRNVRQLLP